MSEWNDNIHFAPKGDVNFLVLLPSGLVTTACFTWYTEGAHETTRPIAYWALHDMVRDEPLDEDGPVEELGFKWMPISEITNDGG